MHIHDFQHLMETLYFANDNKRGIHRTALWLTEELGELMQLLKLNEEELKTPENKIKIGEEMADVCAWVSSLANLLDINLEKSINDKYPNFCIKCQQSPCVCEKSL